MLKHLVYVCVVTLLVTALPAAEAEGVEIQSVSSELLGDVYAVNADIAFQLDAEVREALVHGVALNIDIFIQVRRQRKWLWDPMVIENMLHYRLEYQPLANFYVLTNVVSGRRAQFKSIDETTAALGQIRNHMLLNRASLQPDLTYTGRLRAKLNIDNLPPPLQPTAHVSGRWRLASPWYEWVIR